MKKSKVGKILGGVVIGVAAIAAAPFTGGGSILAGAAALGLGTAAAVASAAAAGAAGGLVGWLWSENDTTSLGIIGMKASGKTTLLFNLGGVGQNIKDTFNDEYKRFSFITKTGKKIDIEKGNDIGGNKNYMSEYKAIIFSKDVIFFFFDVDMYTKDLEYSRECNSRLSFIFPSIERKKIVLIATHADKSNLTKNELRESVLNQVRDKDYSKLFNENFFILNLTDDKQFQDLTENLFG